MATLPTPGGDNGLWGGELNTWLQVGHNADGTHFVVAIPTVVTLTDAATISLNAALGNVFTVTLGGNRTLANPTNPSDGQQIRIRVIQDATGSRTLTYGTAYDFGTAGAPTLSTAGGKGDELGFEYWASLSKWVYLGSVLGN